MEQNSGLSRSGEAVSIFGQSIDVRRPGRSRRRATQKKFSPTVELPAKPSVHQRRAVAERERARAESELSRASSMANELERQIEQTNAKARCHRSELTRASGNGSSIRRKNVLVHVEAPGADQPQDQSNSLYVEVMQELGRVKRELRKLQREVKAARDADAETPTPRVLSSGPRHPLDGVKREAGRENGSRGIGELAEAGGSRNKNTQQATRTHARSQHRDTSRSSDPDERFATASSSEVGLEPAAEMAMVPATEATKTDYVENAESALTITRHVEHDGRPSSPQAAAEAELTSARTEPASVKEEGARLTSSVERARRETARLAEEIGRLAEQEERAGAQVRQLNARLRRARSRLDAAAAADESTGAALTELSAALRRLGEETEAAGKERALTELENRCVREDAEAVGAEIAVAERRVREAVGELEAARAAEAAATEKLRGVVDSLAVTPGSTGNVTIPRFEYDYLTGRGETVRVVAEKKVTAAEAWVEALRAGEKEVVMRAEAIEREIAEMATGEAEEREPRVGLQRAQTRRRPAPKENEVPGTSRRTATPSSSVARKPRPASFNIQGKKRRALVPKYLELIAGKCRGQS